MQKVTIAHCRSCGAEIKWTVMLGGKKNPVDIDPVPNGNLILFENNGLSEVIAVSFDPEKHAGKPRYVSHFATCPTANKWRKPSGQSARRGSGSSAE